MERETELCIVVFVVIELVTIFICWNIVAIRPSENIDGTVIDRGKFGGHYYVMVLFDDPIEGTINFTVDYETWLQCGYGADFDLYWWGAPGGMILNTTCER